MDIRELVIDANKSVGKNLMLVDIIPNYTYENGKRSDNINGYRYVVAMPERALDKLSVRIDGDLLLDKSEDDYPVVLFDGLELSLYWSNGNYQVSAKANGIRLANDNKPQK